MDEVNVHYNNLLYFCEIHWLSRGVMLSRMCDLQQEIATFLRQKNLPHADHFSDLRWLARLALLTDNTTHLSTLNVKLQGKEILMTDMQAHITALQVNLRLWEAQLVNLCIFLTLLLVPLTTWTWTLALVSSPLCGWNLPSVSQVSRRWLRTSSFSPPPWTCPWTMLLPPADGFGGGAAQR